MESPALAHSVPTSDDYLVRTWQLLEVAIRRRWSEGLIPREQDGIFASFLGSDEVEKLLAARAVGAPAEAQPFDDRWLFDPLSPLGRLVRELGLSNSEADLLAVLLACESDPACARLVMYLSGNRAEFQLTVDLLLDLVYRGRVPRRSQAAALALRDLAPHRILRRLQLVVIDGSTTRTALAQTVRMQARVTAWLLGDVELDPELMAHATLYPPEKPVGEIGAELVRQASTALSAGGRLLLVDGPPMSGRELTLRFAACFLELPLLMVSGVGLGPDRLVAAFREASLRGSLLAFRDTDEALAGDGMRRFRECLGGFPGTVALLDRRALSAQVCSLRPSTTIALTVPPMAERQMMWGRYLAPVGAGELGLAEEPLREVAALYNLGIQGIVNASRAAREAARFESVRVARRHVALAVRNLFDVSLSTVATRVEVSQTWDDLVLPEEVGSSILDLLDRVRLRGEVLGAWGFSRKLGKGLGLTALFSGEPGTGKSMVAGLIARELGLDLYVVDLSQVTSKWLGETEKNLARAFDAAEAGHVLLLFDEADSVLCRRSSDVKSSNDRYANMETNFILARLEQFSGVACFTTNLPSAIDPAIARRMSVHIQFPFPDLALRADLWRRMLPAEAPVSRDVDFDRLAQRYELSGGFIRNIVLRAAYLAARDKQSIHRAHLEAAAESEYRERGLLLVGGRLT